MFAYKNHGQSMRSINPGEEEPGEVVFDDYATEAQLQAVFPGRAGALFAEALAQTQGALTEAVQAHMDAVARTHNYDGILSLCTYAASKHTKFESEGAAGVLWRDACWAAGYQVIDDVHAGKRAVPTPEELVAELPEMIWPA